MRLHSPACAVWLADRKVIPTDNEVVAYNACVAAILERERARRLQQIDVVEEEPQVVEEEAAPEPIAISLLCDPKLFESDVDI